MAAGILPKPGTKTGPCKAACRHRDCAESRFIAGCVCRFCSQPVGFGTRFYLDPEAAPATPDDRRWVHAACLEDAIEVAVADEVCRCGYCERCLVFWANDPKGGGAL